MLGIERPMYRSGRVAAIDLLHLRPGQRVLDVGCGAGLNFALLADGVGLQGRVVGVDRNADRLARARRRVDKHRWPDIALRQGEATRVRELAGADAPFDAAVFCYSLSTIDAWQSTWHNALELMRPGGRIAVVDVGLPRGRGRLLSPLARLANRTGGADVSRVPWHLVQRDTTDVTVQRLHAGHVELAVGTVEGRGRHSA